MKYIVLFTLVLSLAAWAGDMKSLAIGENAPSFELKNYDGKDYSIENVRKASKFTVVMFIATRCPVSNAYNDRMEKLNQTYTAKGITFIAVNSNKAEPVDEIAQHAKDHGFTFPVLKDVGNKVADLYGAQVTPETFVCSPDGKLLYHGRIDDSRSADKVQTSDLSVALDALLAGKEPPRAETKAIGCSIKRVGVD
jgi:peroxiredoxin